MEWWDDLWLNEAFATWIGEKITEQVFPQYSIGVESVRPVQEAMGSDAMLSARTIRQPVTDDATIMQAADGLTYQKGMAVLGMFESWMGEELFRDAILNYIEERQWGNARAEDLWAALSETSGVDVGAAMSTFVDQPGVPLLTVTDLGDGKVELRQERYHNYGVEMEGESTWELPVVFRYNDGEETRSYRILLTEPVETVELPSSGELEWIHPNADEKGYYHWSLAPERLRELAENSLEIMDTRERVGFVGQVSALLSAGQIDGATYLEVIAPLARDPQPEVVSAMLSSLGLVRVAFVTPDLENAFAAYVQSMLSPAREQFGLTPREGESEAAALLRPQLVSWLGKYGQDPEVLAYAKEVTASYMETRSAPDPQVVSACLQIAAMDGDWTLYNAYKKGFEAATVPAERQRFLNAMGWFRQDTMMKAALSYTLKGELRPQELFSIPRGIGMSGDHGAALLWDWMTTNYDVLMERVPPVFAVYMPYFAMGCTDDRLEAARIFFAENGPHYMAGQEKELAKVSENVGNCISLRSREGGVVADYLRGVAGM
jgi:alanyl aminopeptidase